MPPHFFVHLPPVHLPPLFLIFLFYIGKDQKKKLEVIMDVVVVDKVVEEVNKKLFKEYNVFFLFYKVKL